MSEIRTVWKFPLGIYDRQTVDVPRGAKALTVQMQGEDGPCLWVMVDANAPVLDTLDVRIHGTGHRFDATGYTYVSTFQMYGGSLVFHAFIYTAPSHV